MIQDYDVELAETWRVLEALKRLCRANPIWNKNYDSFVRMDSTRRIRWWRSAKKQAELGVLAMQQLLLKVIEIRLTES